MAEQQRDNGQSSDDQKIREGRQGTPGRGRWLGHLSGLVGQRPSHAEIRSEGELVSHKGPRPRSTSSRASRSPTRVSPHASRRRSL